MDQDTGKVVDVDQDTGRMDKLARKFKKRMVLSLKEASWEEAGQSLEYAILIKRASGKPLKKKILTEILIGVWKLEEKPSFQKVEYNTMLVNFKSEKDREKVMEGGPWSFEGEALVLQKWEEGMTGKDLNNTKINVFVQLFGLPFELRKEAAARGVVEQFGIIKEHKSNGSLKKSAYGKDYMRFRIEIDTEVPIIPGFFLERRGRDPTWVNLKYERLPNVCYKCGVLSHDTRSCTQIKEEHDVEFGPWLKAEDRSEYIQEWKENRVPVSVQEELPTQIPMCIDLRINTEEVDKGLQLLPYLGKGEKEGGGGGSKVKVQDHVEKAGIRKGVVFEGGTSRQESTNVGPGLLASERRELEGDVEMINVNIGPRKIIEVKRKMAHRKRGQEGSSEEGSFEKKKKLDGGSQGNQNEGKEGTEQKISKDVRNADVEAECAEHLRRDQ